MQSGRKRGGSTVPWNETELTLDDLVTTNRADDRPPAVTFGGVPPAGGSGSCCAAARSSNRTGTRCGVQINVCLAWINALSERKNNPATICCLSHSAAALRFPQCCFGSRARCCAWLAPAAKLDECQPCPCAGLSGKGTCPSTHTVRMGDTLSSIADANGVSLPDLETANPSITDPSLSELCDMTESLCM